MSLWDFVKSAVGQSYAASREQAQLTPSAYSQGFSQTLGGVGTGVTSVLGAGTYAQQAYQAEATGTAKLFGVAPKEQAYVPKTLEEVQTSGLSAEEAIFYPVKKLVKQPASALLLWSDSQSSSVNSETIGGYSRIKNWNDAWNAAEDISLGQELASIFNSWGLGDQSINSTRNQVNRALAAGTKLQFVDSDGFIRPGFKNNNWANWFSGGVDAGTYLLDPLIAAGKGVKVLKAKQFYEVATGAKASKIAAQVDEGTATISDTLRQWAGDGINRSSSANIETISSTAFVSRSANPTIVAGAYSQMIDFGYATGASAADIEKMLRLVTRGFLGDTKAVAALRADREAGRGWEALIINYFDLAAGISPTVDTKLVDAYKLWDSALAKAIGEESNFAAAQTTSPVAADFLVGSPMGRINFRTSGFKPEKTGSFKVREFRKAGGMTQTVIRWAGQGRPTGYIDLKASGWGQAQNLEEVQSILFKAKAAPEESRYWMNRLANARPGMGRQERIASYGEGRGLGELTGITPESLSTRGLVTERETMENFAYALRQWSYEKALANGGYLDELGSETGRLATKARELINRHAAAEETVRLNGFWVSDDVVVHDPLLVAQLKDGQKMAFIDLDSITELIKFDPDYIAQGISAGQRALNQTLRVARAIKSGTDTFLSEVWKPGILLRPAYTLRNLAEASGRIGAMGRLLPMVQQYGAEGTVNFLLNRIAGVKGISADVQERIAVAKYGEGSPEAIAAAEKNVAAQARISEPFRAGDVRRGYAVEVTKRGKVKLKKVSGEQAQLEEAFGETSAGLRGAASAEATVGRIVRPNEMPKAQFGEVGWKRSELNNINEYGTTQAYEQASKEFWDDYARVVNNQVIGDQLAYRILKNGVDETRRWLNSSDSLIYREMNGMKGADRREINAFYDVLATRLDDLVPMELRDEIVKARGLTAKQYKNVLDSLAIARGMEHGGILVGPVQAQLFSSAKEVFEAKNLYRKIINYGFKKLGSDPENVFIRHPFLSLDYKAQVGSRLENLAAQGIDVTALDADTVYNIQRSARMASLKNLKTYIYTIDRYSNGAAAVTTLSPFIAAFNNTVRTWGRIIGENPESLVYINDVFQSPARAGIAIDLDTGQPVSELPFIPSSKIGLVIPIPSPLRKSMFKDLPENLVLAPPMSSLNLTLQQSPIWMPPTGPVVAVPVALMANWFPSNQFIQSLSKYIFPAQGEGQVRPTEAQVPRDVWKQLLPTALRNFFNKEDADGTVRARVYALMIIEEMKRNAKEGKNPLEIDYARANRATEQVFKFKILGSPILPFGTNLVSREDLFLINKYREYEQAGNIQVVDTATGAITDKDPVTRFVDDFGPLLNQEYGRGSDYIASAYTFSTSKNNTGAQASVTAQKLLTAYGPDFLGKVASFNPRIIGALVNDPNGSEFNSAVYNWELNNGIGPGAGGKNFRETRSGEEAIRETQIERGFQKYLAGRQQIESLLRFNNLKTIQQAPALQKQWQSYLADLKAENPAFAEELGKRNEAKYSSNADGFRLVLNNPEVQKRNVQANSNIPILELKLYLDSRDDLRSILPVNYQAGVLNSKKYAQVESRWNSYVSDLIAQNPRFGQIYYRYFDGEFSTLDQVGTVQ